MAKPNPKFNNYMPLLERYYAGTYDKIYALHKKGWTQTRIGARYKVTKARVQQICSKRAELDKLPKRELEMHVMSPQAVKWLQRMYGKRVVSRSTVREGLKTGMIEPLGPRMRISLQAYANGKT